MTHAKPLTRLTGAAALGIATALTPLAAPVLAQEQSNGAQTGGQTESQPGTAYTDEVLSSFVDAAMAVSEVRDTFIPQVQNAETEEAAQALAQEAVMEMREAVTEAEGIDVDTYMAIGEAAQTDEELAQRISAIVEERQGDAGDMPEDG
jgi:hypothetical protein